MKTVDQSPGSEQIETVIVGGGQAGLALSFLLTQQGREHVVLEKREQVGATWRQRWDSFTLVTPNWTLRLPGHYYEEGDSDGFLARDNVVTYLERYAASFDPPLQFGVEVTAVTHKADDSGYLVHTDDRTYEAQNVVVATGTFQKPKIPAASQGLSPSITRLHSNDYSNPQALPDGAVLVVGGGQSGCQIAQELKESGRRVYLSVGSAGRLPRHYRGRDGMWWADRLGLFDQTVDKLSSPEERFEANPQVSGKNDGCDINLHEFAREGINLLGRLEAAREKRVALGHNLHESLAKADKTAAEFRKAIDKYVRETGLNAPPEEVHEPQDGYNQEIVTSLDLDEAGISTVLWATGYRWDYGWVKLPIFDDYGYPQQQRGVTPYPGLYFLGLHFLHTRKSCLFYGVGDDAQYIAAHIDRRMNR